MTLNLFYQEPNPDRWVPYDRYPRALARRLVRGAPRPGGQMMVFLNLVKGLDRIGQPYRVNDFRYARHHPDELACIVGKPQVLFDREWKNPVLFGASIFSHPIDHPDLFERYPVREVLVPGEWMRRMFEPTYGDRVTVWPVGIDTDEWTSGGEEKTVDFLLYDKVRWDHDAYEASLIRPIKEELVRRGLTHTELRYGSYEPDDLKAAVRRCRAALFLCEHETQGIAYQQMLSSGVPILAWDRGGDWQDPQLYPDRVRFGPVSSVPYWDERCGVTFENAEAFAPALDEFLEGLAASRFAPRNYVVENLTLEASAQQYTDIARSVV